MNQTKSGTEMLQFIFTEKDFCLDAQSRQEEGSPEGGQESWRSRFEADKYHALYQMGFEEKRENLTAAEGFLHLLSDTFLKRLTSLPELELGQENVPVRSPHLTLQP